MHFNLKLFVSLDSWSGFVPASTAFDTLTGAATNNTDLLNSRFLQHDS